jgi:2-polyprenyl-6-methoxyphenol hydroxylase-like FAD-dependent oxidoreductase
MSDVIIVGGGIGGLSLALALEKAGIDSTIYEATPVFQQAGVGINVLPYAMRVLAGLGLEKELEKRAIPTWASAYFDRCGSPLHQMPVGRFAGETWPQLSIHRAELQAVLLDAVRERLGPHRIRAGWECVGVSSEHDDGPCLSFRDRRTGQKLEPQRAGIVVACDGIHSKIRQQFYPDEGAPRYSGIFMWRGVTRRPKFLDGATMVRVGLPSVGKMVIYPIRNYDDGTQLINWVAEVEVPDPGNFCSKRDWNCPGDAKDFVDVFADWRFDWLDVPELIRNAHTILQFPMMDRDPLPRWSFGRVTLLGDAAHPLVPLGSNGAGQAILDAEVLARELASCRDPAGGLARCESIRLPATAEIVMSDRAGGPDVILQEGEERLRLLVPVPTGRSAFPRSAEAA